MRKIVPVCALILIFTDNITSLTEDIGRKCDSDFECLPSKDCQWYQDQQDLLKSLTDKTSRSRLIRKLRKLICNRKERGICCPLPQECGRSQTAASNIVGGEKTNPGEFPFSVLIGNVERKFAGTLPGGKRVFRDRENWICSGVLLNNQFVLTAAHCKTEDDVIKVNIGVHELPGSGEVLVKYSQLLPDVQNFDVKPENFVIHEDYSNQYTSGDKKLIIRNDIALIKLPRPVYFNQLVQPSCWKNQSSVNIDDTLVVVGWGKTSAFQVTRNINGVYSNDQKKLEVPVLDTIACLEHFSLDSTHICAGGNKGEDSCHGDSGGGLFSEVDGKWEVVGIVSFGAHKCGDGTPGVYTRVSQYLPWIEQTMKRM